MSKILTMKLYFDNFNIPNLNHLKKNETENLWFLSYFGKYKLSQNKIFLYKINDINSIIIDNFINNNTCFVSNEIWKKNKEVYYLPKDCIPLQIKKENYIIDSKLSFVIEKINNEINDYYFETQYALDDFCLKNELISFLHT